MTQVVNPTETRVEQNTEEKCNQAIMRDIEARICFYSERLNDIEKRLEELRYEWDIERCLEANAASLSMIGVCMGITVNRRWFLLPGIIGAFLLQHAVEGWCPPIVPLRRLGVRTMREINYERYALKALRGDFDAVNSKATENGKTRARQALHAVGA